MYANSTQVSTVVAGIGLAWPLSPPHHACRDVLERHYRRDGMNPVVALERARPSDLRPLFSAPHLLWADCAGWMVPPSRSRNGVMFEHAAVGEPDSHLGVINRPRVALSVYHLGDLGDEHVALRAPAGNVRVVALVTHKRSYALKVFEDPKSPRVVRTQPDSVDRDRPTTTTKAFPPHRYRHAVSHFSGAEPSITDQERRLPPTLP